MEARNGFKIKNLNDHIILFTFDNKGDVDRILSSEPWSFDKHLVAMQQYEKETPISDIKFEKDQFLGSATWHPFTIHDIGSGFEDKQCDLRSISPEGV